MAKKRIKGNKSKEPKHFVKIGKHFSAEYKKLAKRANQRMVRLEQKGIQSPAYNKVQALMEMAGIKKKSARGRRFSETGKYTDANELRKMMKIINSFLESKTSTKAGYLDYLDKIYQAANENYNLDSAGISKEDYLAIFEALPDKESERVFYASYYIEVVEAYQMKKGQLKNENALSIEEIVNIMQESQNYKQALQNVGITVKDINKTKKLKKKKSKKGMK